MPRKLEPGLAATNSKFSDLITSTMKSPPGRSVVSTSTVEDGSVSRAGVGALGEPGVEICGGAAEAAAGTSAAAPVTAALLRKPRRSTDSFSDMGASLHPADGPWEITPGLKDPAYTVRNRLATV